MTSLLYRFFLIVNCAFVAAYAATHTVNFRDNVFDPAALTVDVGDTVRFQHQEGFHTVTGAGNDPFCGNDQVSDSCSVTFNTPGTFPYRCLFHSTSGPNPQGMVGSITVRPAIAEKPNLVTFRLSGWTSPLVLSREPGDNISDPDFADDQDIFVDWAIANISLTTGITPRFFTEIRLNGESKGSWFHDGLAPDTFNKIEDFNLGKLPIGEYTLRLVTDHTSVIDESNEQDNTFDTSFRVIRSTAHSHTVLVSDFRFNPASLTIPKGDEVTFWNLEGSHTATGTGTDPFCGNGAINGQCTVKFNTAGLFPYRCIFHSSEGPNPQGMVGQIRVLDPIVAERAAIVTGPFGVETNALVNYPNQTVTFPLPSNRAFWRLNTSTALRITNITANSTSVVLKFE
jgi:plastocyanin